MTNKRSRETKRRAEIKALKRFERALTEWVQEVEEEAKHPKHDIRAEHAQLLGQYEFPMSVERFEEFCLRWNMRRKLPIEISAGPEQCGLGGPLIRRLMELACKYQWKEMPYLMLSPKQFDHLDAELGRKALRMGDLLYRGAMLVCTVFRPPSQAREFVDVSKDPQLCTICGE